MEQKPSIGRIVHYHHNGKAKAAIVTDVYTPGGDCVELHVLWGAGDIDQARSIKTSVAFSAQPKDGYWSWPPRT